MLAAGVLAAGVLAAGVLAVSVVGTEPADDSEPAEVVTTSDPVVADDVELLLHDVIRSTPVTTTLEMAVR